MALILTIVAAFHFSAWLYLLGYSDGTRMQRGQPRTPWRVVIALYAWPIYAVEFLIGWWRERKREAHNDPS